MKSVKRIRSIEDLLYVMYNNQSFFSRSLCEWVLDLSIYELINRDERNELLNYIKNNKPSRFSSLSSLKSIHTNFYWVAGEIEPRLKWLKKHIKKNENYTSIILKKEGRN